jgi:hypothetical protein
VQIKSTELKKPVFSKTSCFQIERIPTRIVILNRIYPEFQKYPSYADVHSLRSVVLIPGYGAYFGAKLHDISTSLKKRFPSLSIELDDFTADLQWLSEHEHIVLT